MMKFYSCDNEGFVEMAEWQPHYWISVEQPTGEDCAFLRNLNVPESFMENIADIDERPRFEHEDGWLLTILRIPHHFSDDPMKYITVPLGVMTKDDVIITVCHTCTEMIPDFINHSNKRHVNIDNQPDFVLRLVYSSTYWFLQYLKDINNTVSDFTRQLEKSVRNEVLLNMMQLQEGSRIF